MMIVLREIAAAAALGFALLVASCAEQQAPSLGSTTQREMEGAKVALEPSSQKAAEDAVRQHFDETLIDPESARYTFRPYTRGAAAFVRGRRIGVFMCGTVNAKNRMGGYTGRKPFLAYFDPARRDYVVEASTEDFIAYPQCSNLYGPV